VYVTGFTENCCILKIQNVLKQTLPQNFEKVYNGCQVKALTEINSWKNTQI
jgi:hypothetical protein